MKLRQIIAGGITASLLVILTVRPTEAGFHPPAAPPEPHGVFLPMDHARLEDRGAQLTGAIHLEGVLMAISKTTATVAHAANDRIGWPAMTMDLPLAPYVEIASGLAPGSAVTMMLTMGEIGHYRIAAIAPGAGAPLQRRQEPRVP